VTDFILAIVIFSMCMLLFYKTMPNIKMNAEKPVEEVYLDAKSIASMIISEGSPNNWTCAQVQRIGIIEKANNISTRKVTEFYNLSTNDYTKSKTLLGITSEYIVYFVDKDSTYFDINDTGVIGHHGVNAIVGPEHTNITKIKRRNMVRLERILVYNSSPVKMVIYTWN